MQPQGFFKIEEEQISTINSRIKELEADPTYQTLKQRLKTETEQATVALTKAKAELKANKEARELRRQSVAFLSEEEQTALIKESQFQKANFKRLEREWKKLLEERKAEVVAFETAIEDLKMERKERSAALQQKLFQQFRMLNAKGEVKDLCTIFKETVHKIPPGGLVNAHYLNYYNMLISTN